MGKMITGSIDFTKLYEQAKAGHSAFKKAQNGRIYVNLLVWENDEKDQYGNNFSIQLNAGKDAPEEQRKIYIGNMKHLEAGTPTASNVPSQKEFDDLPF